MQVANSARAPNFDNASSAYALLSVSDKVRTAVRSSFSQAIPNSVVIEIAPCAVTSSLIASMMVCLYCLISIGFETCLPYRTSRNAVFKRPVGLQSTLFHF